MHNYSDFLTMSQLSVEEFAYLLSSASVQRSMSTSLCRPEYRSDIRETLSANARYLRGGNPAVGAWPILLGSMKVSWGARAIPDLARNLSLWVDGIVARVFRHVDLEELAHSQHSSCVNAFRATGSILVRPWQTFLR
jgi:ornithine carbamoyltransferase